jgi:alpha-beta hydrolase superfamily lysophospholipase
MTLSINIVKITIDDPREEPSCPTSTAPAAASTIGPGRRTTRARRSVTAALAIARDASPWTGAVLSGTPIEPPAWVAEAAAADALALQASDLSSDPAYLDALANDPLAFTETTANPLDVLPAGWEELSRTFAGVALPVLFVHGELDPLAPVAGSRRWAQVLPSASLAEFAGAKHDILNEAAHAEVAAAISAWVLDVAAQPAVTR